MQIERHEIRVFHAIAAEGSFRRAAQRLHVSPSAVSQALSGLEHRIGMPLLRRTSPPQLTEAGLRLLGYAETVLNEESAALRDIELIRSGALSTLSLALSNGVNHRHGRELALEFCRRNPLTRLKLDVAPSREIVHGVADDRWELGFGPFRHEMPGYFTLHECFRETRTLVAGREHPRLEALQADPERTLAETTLITSYLDDPGRRPGLERLRNAFGSVWEVSHMGLRLALTAEGMGVTYVSDLVLPDHPDCADLVPIEGPELTRIERRVGLYYKTDRPLSEAARRFLQLCRERWGV